ncbi:MAG: flagellar hook-associated protein FlgL [Bacteriovoracia bacterium]
MSRVSENSTTHAINHSLSKTKSKLEDLHLKGTSLKAMVKPSDDPVGNIDALKLRSENTDLKQYQRNMVRAKTSLEYTESALQDLTEIMNKAKEIAIGQSSDIYSADIRKNVAAEVSEIRRQALAIANRRLGNRHIFAGHKTLTEPFDIDGNYYGDNGNSHIEISKDNFIPINLTGKTVFLGEQEAGNSFHDPFNSSEARKKILDGKIDDTNSQIKRDLASEPDKSSAQALNGNLFKQLETLETALLTNDPDLIQDLLPKLEQTTSRLITLRTRIGATTNTIYATEESNGRTELANHEQRSRIEDADIAELFSDIAKQQNILKASYKAGTTVLNKSLLDFLR